MSATASKSKRNPAELLIFGNPRGRARKKNHRMAPIPRGSVGDKLAQRFEAKLKLREMDRHQRALIKKGFSPIEARRLTVEKFGFRNPEGSSNHKPGCKCPFCARAKKIAVADKKMPKQVRAVMSPNPKRRNRNPSDLEQAVSLYESFSGSDAKKLVERHESAAMRLDYTALGDLFKLLLLAPGEGEEYELTFDGDKVKLASSPDGKQLYLIGGNQDLGRVLRPESLAKDFVDLGDVAEISYDARKVHNNFEPTEWVHKFGEKTGDLPRAWYDKIRKRIYFAGGAYFIKSGPGGISPGIEN